MRSLPSSTALAIPDEQLFYENLKPKSHFYALRTQLEWMLDRQRREEYEGYIIEQGEIAGHKTLVASNLEKASDFAVANLFYYFRVRDESEDELELDSDDTKIVGDTLQGNFDSFFGLEIKEIVIPIQDVKLCQSD